MGVAERLRECARILGFCRMLRVAVVCAKQIANPSAKVLQVLLKQCMQLLDGILDLTFGEEYVRYDA